MTVNTLPLNRLLQQVARDGHLTFNKKWRDLLLQIFGHEGLIANNDTADIAHCTDLNEDFYRMSTLRWEHFAPRKLLNPFKWLEFLLTAPLEILSWSIGRLTRFLYKQLKENIAPIQNRYLRFGLGFIQAIFFVLLVIAPAMVNIAVNLITGVLRRFLAPVRYIIRPAIETARKYPKSFSAIVAISVGIGIALTVTVLTGGLPVILGGLFLSGSLAVKLTAISIAATAQGALLTKGFNTLRELVGAVKSKINRPSADIQMRDVDERNQELNYKLKFLLTDQAPNKTTLDAGRIKPPLLIKYGEKVFIYGRAGGGGTQLKQLKTYDGCEEIYCWVFRTANLNEVVELGAGQLEDILDSIYEDINWVRGHITEKIGSTDKITEAFHAIDIQHTEVRLVARQDKWYTAALITGTESIFFPKKASSTLPAFISDESKEEKEPHCQSLDLTCRF